MQRLLDLVGRAVARQPGAVVGALVLAVAALGAVGSQLEVETDIQEFGGGTEAAERFLRVDEEFGVLGTTVVVIVDAGADGDVLDPDGLALASGIVAAVEGHDRLEGRLAEDGALAPAVLSWAAPVERAAEVLDTDLADLEGDELDVVVAEAYADPAASQALGLLPDGFEPGGTTAEAGVVLVRLAPDLDDEALAEAGVAVRDALEGVDLTGFEVLTFSQGLLEEELEDLLFGEMPVLAAAALAVVVVVLAITYRRFVDVALTLVGLLLTLAAMAGLIVLAGPDFLGLTGPFTQVGVAVPVLLLGLSVDYAIHLTSRYRQERVEGDGPGDAASRAIRNVGRALVLVTATTVVGFLANVISPVPPIRDFAVFMAIGVVNALVVMALFVPAARSWLDRRLGSDPPPEHVPGRLVGVMQAVAGVATRGPRLALGVCVAAALVGALGAVRLDTEFSRDEFIPEGADAAAVLAVMEERFGGDLTRNAYLLVDGDWTDPELANAALEVTDRLAGSELVRQRGGEPAVRSAPALVAQVAGVAERPEVVAEGDEAELLELAAEQLAAAGWEGDRFAPEADVAAAYDLLGQASPGGLATLLDEDRSTGLVVVETTASDDELDRLEATLAQAAEPLVEAGAEIGLTGEQLLTDATLDLLVRSQLQKMGVTAGVALALLVVWFTLWRRRPLLGVITLVPTLLALPVALGTMWLLGLSFNALTAVITSVAIGFGVDYGIHVSNRFLEDRERCDSAADAIRATVSHTGAALVASATTTAGALSVLMLSGLVQVRHLGGLTALVIVLALLVTLVAQTSCLVLMDRRRTA
jgi:uncharacterized protein